jgi:hypothetical protein
MEATDIRATQEWHRLYARLALALESYADTPLWSRLLWLAVMSAIIAFAVFILYEWMTPP